MKLLNRLRAMCLTRYMVSPHFVTNFYIATQALVGQEMDRLRNGGAGEERRSVEQDFIDSTHFEDVDPNDTYVGEDDFMEEFDKRYGISLPDDFTFDDWCECLDPESGEYDEKALRRAISDKHRTAKQLDKLRNGKGSISKGRAKFEEKKKLLLKKIRKAENLYSESSDADGIADDLELDPVSAFRNLRSEIPKKLRKYFSIVEDVLLGLVSIGTSSNVFGATAGILLLVKGFVKNDEALVAVVFRALFSECTLDSIVGYFQGISTKFDKEVAKATGLVAESSNSVPSNRVFLGLFDGIQILRSSELVHSVTRFISILMAAGLVGNSRGRLELSVGSLNLFSIQAAKEVATGSTLFDLIEAAITVGHLFMTKLWVCFERRSIKPLFMSEWGGDEYHKQYTDIMAYGPDMLMGAKCKLWPTFGAYVDNLRYLIGTTKRIISISKGVEKRVLADKMTQLKKQLAKAEEKEADGGLRKAPFSFFISGASSAGKSTIVNILIDYSLKRIAWDDGNKEFITDPRNIAVSNEADDYDSDIHSFTLATLDDDKANAAFGHTKSNPTDIDIRFINNIKRKAIKAALEEKDRIPIEPLVSAATGNVPDLWAWEFSNAPESALRRYILHIKAWIAKDWQAKQNDTVHLYEGQCASREVSIKEEGLEFSKLDHAKMAEESENGNFYPDAWRFDVTEWLPVTKGTAKRKVTKQCEPLEIVQTFYSEELGKEIKSLNIGMSQLLELFSTRITSHTRTQNSVVRSSDGVFQQTLCPHGHVSNFCGRCKAKAAEEAALKCVEISDLEVVPEESEKLEAESSWMDRERSLTRAEREFAKAYKGCQLLRKNPLTLFIALLPEKISLHPAIVCGYAALLKQNGLKRFAFFNALIFTAVWAVFVYLNTGVNWCCLYTFSHLSLVGIYLALIYKYCFNKIKKSSYMMRRVARASCGVIDGWRKYLALGFSAGLSFMALLRLWKCVQGTSTVQEEAGTTFTNDVKTENPWLTVDKHELPQSLPVNSQFKDLSENVKKAQMIVRYFNGKADGAGSWSNGFVPFSRFIILPWHEVNNIPDDGLEIGIYSTGPNNLGSENFRCRIFREDVKLIGESGKSDLALVAVYRLGPRKDLSHVMLGKDEWADTPMSTVMFFRQTDHTITSFKCKFDKFEPCVTKGDQSSFEKGAWYAWKDTASFAGLCLSTHVYAHGSRASILGFHLAGSRKKGGYNAAQLINRSELKYTASLFDEKVYPTVSEIGSIPTKQYGIDFTPVLKDGRETNLGYQTAGQAMYLGTMPKAQTRPKTSIVKSPIADIVEEVTGQEQLWGPPATCRKVDGKKVMKAYEPYKLYVEGVANANQEIPTPILKRAVDDYDGKIAEIFAPGSEQHEYASKVRPLTEWETISGQDGVKFVDAMKMGTSMGWPINKPKRDFFTELAPSEEIGNQCPRVADADTIKECDRLKACWDRGEKGNPIFKCCTKDEALPLEKRKVRAFQAGQCAMTMLTRQYFLPIIGVISRYPLDFECAVGINSQGPQWDELVRYISEDNEDRFVAGDFKKFDQNMSARTTLCAFGIMIRFAEKYMDYSAEDIARMKMIVVDLAYPIISVNGDLALIFGSNPSGQSLTVYLNSIVNSIYHRCAFFSILPHVKGLFHHYVRLTSYGDDVWLRDRNRLGNEYNHTSIAEVFASWGITYTMAQKEADSVPYINLDEVEYLKRWTRFDPELSYKSYSGEERDGMYIAYLDDQSIFKSLMCNSKSKENTTDELAIQCIEGAMREWFFHGPDKFEERHDQMKEVVKRMDYTDWISPSFFDSYETRKDRWMEKYGISYVE